MHPWSRAQGSGVELILTSPDRINIEYAQRFDFKVSNNEAEYEAVIARLKMDHFMEVEQLVIHSDSQPVVK